MSLKNIPALFLATLFFAVTALNIAQSAEPIRVGIFEDGRAKAVPEIIKTLEEEGFQTGIIKAGPKADFREIYNYDVLYFSGGWGQYDWLTPDERMHLVEFVEQRGGGAIFSIFRCGATGRSMIRPLFPEVAEAYTKVNSRGMRVVKPDHPVMTGLPEIFLTPYLDHAVMRLGPHGIALALNSGGSPAVACGEAGRGRVVFIGAWIGIDNTGKDTYPLPETDRKLLLNSIRWASGSPCRDRESPPDLSETTMLKVMRREKTIDWIHDDIYRNWRHGLLTSARNLREHELDILSMRLAGLAKTAENTEASANSLKLKNEIAGLRIELRENHVKAVKEKEFEISRMSLEQLMSEPVRDLSMTNFEHETIQTLQELMLFQYKIDAAENAVRELEQKLASALEKHRSLEAAAARSEDAGNLRHLISALKSQKPSERAYAALELARIGEPQTATDLINILNDPDYETCKNAIYGLSWMQESKAVPPLIKLLESSTHTPTRRRAAQALGQIGDPRALDALTHASQTDSDTHVRQNSILALRWISDGKGVSQPGFLKHKRHFYWMEDQYNAIYGSHTSWRYRPEDPMIMLNYAAASGGTALISFYTTDEWIERYPDIDLDEYFDQASMLGIKISTQIPTPPEVMDKALFEREIIRLAGHKAFGGLWGEENFSLEAWARTRTDQNFQRFLATRYSAEKLAELGISDISKVTMPQPDGNTSDVFEKDGTRADKVLFAEYMEYVAELGTDNWREIAEWIAGLRKGAKFSFSTGAGYDRGASTYIRAYPEISMALDAAGPQNHNEHSSFNNFKLDLQVNGEPRPARGEFLAHLTDTISRMERGFASSLVYGQQFFNRISPRPGLWWWTRAIRRDGEDVPGDILYDRARLEAAMRQFKKGKALSKYLAPRETRGAGLVTQLYSGRTTTLTYGDGTVDGVNRGGRIAEQTPRNYPLRYTQDQQALWESIVRSHLPVEMTWLETQNPAKLAGYKVAILANAVSIDSMEAEIIREWVGNGGTLIATASSTLHDQWDRKQKNYSLADVFGVNYVSTGGNPILAYLDRDIKPESGIHEIRITEPEYFLHMEGAVSAEYEKDAGYDVVEPTTARVVGVWADDGTPAVLENRFGNGHVIFIAARYPALSHFTRDWTFYDLYKEYWPGMRELLAACVRRGLTLTGTDLPVEVENCPETVDVILKRQEQNNRWMTHLLNMDEKNGLIQNIRMTVKPPRQVKAVYYAYPKRSEIEFERTDNGIKFDIRPFDVHEMVVVEF